MKKLILTFAVLMGVSAATTTYANDGIEIVKINFEAKGLEVKAMKGLKFELKLNNLQKKSYIAIKNTAGEIFYSEFTVKTSSFSKIYDLSNLVDGDYYFEVITGNEKMVKPFKISTQVNRTAVTQD
jgi:hypothetical protein